MKLDILGPKHHGATFGMQREAATGGSVLSSSYSTVNAKLRREVRKGAPEGALKQKDVHHSPPLP